MAPSKDKWIRRFVINETTLHKQGFTIYKVTSMIFQKSSPDAASKVSVWKRYNDFKKLHAKLKTLHGTLRIKEPFPVFPKPKFFGRFESEVVEERRACAVKFLEFIARHSSLFTNDIFVTFFETSLGDNCSADCSQSISSDTSEDDKHENLENIPNITRHSLSRNLPNSFGQSTMKDNLIDERVVSIEKTNLLDSDLSTNPDKDKQMLNNNTMDKNSDDINWQRFLSVEKLVENGKGDVTQRCETFLSIHDGSDLADTGQDSGQYILIAAAHMSAGFRHEAMAEYEEAFMQYKLGISNLRHGVQKDPDIGRRATINDKIVKYSERADRLYNRHLNCNISMISKPMSELRYYKVLRVVGSVMLVNNLHQGTTRIIKTVEKSAGIQEDISKYILRGKVPYMVQLHACIQTETTVFLILQYASGGKLWDFLKTQYAIPHGKMSTRKKNHARSTSCEAVIHSNSEKRMDPSLDRSREEMENLRKADFLPSINALELEESVSEEEASLQKLEEEFGANSIYKKDVPTTKLLEKAQQLLKSVDATIKKSNSIATRLNESRGLLYETAETNGSKEPDDCENTDGSFDPSELSTSDSCTDLSTGSDRMYPIDQVAKTISYEESCAPITDEIQRKIAGVSQTTNQSLVEEGSNNERLSHDEDSGIEMEPELWRIPETILKSWAAQILLTLEALHQQEVIISDLRPDNLLVDENHRILLSYVVPRQNPELSRYQKPYTAPELCMYLPVVPATSAADVWSYGVLLYELFTGISFQSQHPGPFHSHSIISIPNDLSESAKLLLTNILKFDPSERLTIPEIKQLSFFEKTDWLSLLNV